MTIGTSQLLSIAEAARRTGYISEASLRAQVAAGTLDSHRICGRVFIPAEALDALLKRRGVK
jgi:hypothetical protein